MSALPHEACSDALTLWCAMCVGLALCPIVTACGGSTPRHVAASPAAIAPIVVTQVEVAPVVSEPPVISLGTVGSTLPLEETDLEASSPFFGEVAEGPEVGHVHRWSLADTGALVVVSWLGFREPASDAGDLLPDGPVRVWRSSSRELGLGSTFLASGTRSAHVSVPLVVRATLLAAPRGGSITNIALACRPDDAGCLGADLAGPIDTLARSLRVGPAIGGGTWTLSLPDGPTHDVRLSVPLPSELAGLPFRGSAERDWQALAVSTRTGEIVLRLSMGLVARQGAREACAPYECTWRAAPGHEAELAPFLASVVRESISAEVEDFGLIEGRLALRAPAPASHRPADAYWGVGPMATHESHVRLATSETEAAVLRIDARDSLRTIEWPPRWPIDLGISLLEEGALEELPSADPALSVFFETRTASRFSLHVIEHGGTAIELTVRPVAGQVEPRASARAIAANLRRLGPPRTTSRWQTHVGDLAFEVELPAGFATSHDEILDEGWAEDAAIYLGSPASELDFVEGESPPRRTADESVTLVLAEGTADALPLTFGAHRTGGGEAWLAPVPCRCRRRCTIEVHGEPAQRERLLAALAAAHVRRRVGTIEDVHVRDAPADDARDVGRIWPSREVHVLRTVDGWAEIDGHDSTSSPGRPVRGWIPARALGPHC